jgi:hypothetical protein
MLDNLSWLDHWGLPRLMGEMMDGAWVVCERGKA